MSIRFDGKVAVVTGGAMGIGAAAAQKFASLGAAVAILDRNAEAGQAAAEALGKGGQRVTFHRCDVSSEPSVKDAIYEAVQHHGALHVLASNAGIQRYGNVVNTSSDVWDNGFNIHVKGCFYATKYSMPAMIQSGGGAIVIVASSQSFTAIVNIGSLRRREARAAGAYPFHRARLCVEEYTGQLCLSWDHRHAHVAPGSRRGGFSAGGD
jgi:3-oxoacyl-[acyl-carrier protein] reductase